MTTQDKPIHLSPRCEQVMRMTVTGMRCKQIASELGLSEATIKYNRCLIIERFKSLTFERAVFLWTRQEAGL